MNHLNSKMRLLNHMCKKQLSPLLFLALLSFNPCIVLSQAVPSTNFAKPSTVSQAAYARTSYKLYIAGGSSIHQISQFISLDLTIPWNASQPAWEILTDGPTQNLFPAAFSADEKTMIAFHCNSPFSMIYDVESNTWRNSTLVPTNNLQGVGAVTDPNTGLVYLAGGYTGPRNSMTIYDFNSDTFNSVSPPLPNMSRMFISRGYYGNVFSKIRNSILYFGGYNFTLKSDTHNNIVTEYRPVEGDWTTLNPSGTPPAMRADHCMTSNIFTILLDEDGSIVVVYGGRLGATGQFSGDLYILDTVGMVWRTGLPGDVRGYVTCTIAGDQLLIWGGQDINNLVVGPDMLIYNLTTNTWITNYTPPLTYAQHAPPIDTNPTTSNADEDSSHAGVIAGGVVAGIALICILVLVYIFYIRKSISSKERPLISAKSGEFGDSSSEVNINCSVDELRTLRDQVRTQQEELEMQRRLLIIQQRQNQDHQREQARHIQEQQELLEQQYANLIHTGYHEQNPTIPTPTNQHSYHHPLPLPQSLPMQSNHIPMSYQNISVTSPSNSSAVLSIPDSYYIYHDNKTH